MLDKVTGDCFLSGGVSKTHAQKLNPVYSPQHKRTPWEHDYRLSKSIIPCYQGAISVDSLANHQKSFVLHTFCLFLISNHSKLYR